MIECKHFHSLSRGTKGICSNGVVYYLAWISYDVQSVICFDLGSESFNVIKLPGNIKAEFLANYSEKIAVTSMLFDGSLDLWVLDDASKQEWSKISIIVMYWRDLVGNHSFKFKGTLRTGELIFEPCYSKPYFLLFLDLKKKTARNVMIEGFGTAYISAEVFLHHVESPMFLKIR
ncbi:F-box/kelch-repeat protein [Cardamine amara subsp. amara]|uniref:F-box/kelch-repeat protein n=1 Tax=Cardamine amara subsp. amara TaxID=228776 RepID=A0ABD0YZR4_CARAN